MRGSHFSIDNRLVPSPDKVCYVHAEGEVTCDRDGKPLKFFGTVLDITERKRAEEALREAKVYAENLIETANVIVIGLDREGKVTVFNETAEEITGYSRAEMIGQSFEVIVPMGRYSFVWKEFDRLMDGGWPRNFENSILTKSGEERFIVWQNNEVLEQGRIVGSISFGMDITGRKRAEEALRESEERYRGLFESSLDGIVITDMAGYFIKVNAAFMEMLGYSEEEFRHLTYHQLTPVRWHDFEERIVQEQIIPRGYSDEYEKEYIRKDGSVFPISIRTWLIKNDAGQPMGMWAIVRDITERKRAEEKQAYIASFPEMNPNPIFEISDDDLITYCNPTARQKFPDLEVAGIDHPLLKDFGTIRDNFRKSKHNKLSRDVLVKDIFYQQFIHYLPEWKTTRSYMFDITERKHAEESLIVAKQQAELYVDLMGHDINNMNHSAMGYLELALQELEREKRLRLDDKLLIEKPMQALNNSSALIKNVRKLQQLMTEGVKTKPTDLNNIFRELEATSFHLDDRDVLINIQHVAGIMVEANELLKDVFLNLITNAIRHSDMEKPLTVNVKVEPVNENGQKYYRCMVEDDGPGIPDVLKGKLFHRFQRGTTKAHGKGLGLYIVRTLVEGYHGRVWVEDRVTGDHTKGARFMVLLPVVDSP